MTEQTALSCREVVELVSGYLDGELDHRTAALVEEHLAICQGCADYLDQMRRTIAMLGEVTPETLSPEVLSGLMQAFGTIHPTPGP